MAVNLQKGQKISLDKEVGGQLSSVVMGLGWDVAKKKGLFGLFGGREVGIISSYHRAFAAQEIQHGNAAAAHPGHEDFLVLPFAFHSILHAARFALRRLLFSVSLRSF